MSDTVIQRARDWLSFASPREPGWALIRDLAAEIDNLTLQNESCGNALVDSEAENQRLREALVGLLDAVEDYGLNAAFGDEKFKTIVAAREALAGDAE